MSEPGLCTAQLAVDYFLRLEPRVISLASVGGEITKTWTELGHRTPNRAVLGSGESATSSCRSLVSLLRPQPLYVDAMLHQNQPIRLTDMKDARWRFRMEDMA